MKKFVLLSSLCTLSAFASAQITFSFDDASQYGTVNGSSLSAGGLTATFATTGNGFSYQAAGALGFTPAGFSGISVYPNSVFAADLIISFNKPITDFSIMYAPEEYACDSSARMLATATLLGTPVGTNTTTTYAGTWPTGTLTYANSSGFDRVVVHYDAPPPTGGDWGPIFMADNMIVTPQSVPEPLSLVAIAAGFAVLLRKRRNR